MSLHIGEFGSTIRITVTDGSTAIDISTATSKFVRYRKPDGTVVESSATWTTDGTDGQLEWELPDVVNAQGTWQFNAKIVFSTTATYFTDASSEEVPDF